MDLIGHITVSSVSRVEITSRMDTRYGTMGANGVIAIYTKKVQGRGDKVRTFDTFQVPGFKRPNEFAVAQNYAGNDFPEYTPTQYWNPDVKIDSKQPIQISLTALNPNIIFQVTIMGVTNAGIPVTGCFLLEGGSLKPLSASLDQHQK